MKNIRFSGKQTIDYEIYAVSDTEIGIKSYIGKNNLNALVIPSHINGKKVVEIGSFAFANDCNGEYNITEIIIPNTINKIGVSAFENCTNLDSVIFSDKSVLKTIEKNAFYGCTNLFEIMLPASIEKLNDYSFAYCTNLYGEKCLQCKNNERIEGCEECAFQLPNNLKSIGENVFLATNVSNIYISDSNSDFTVSNSTLYNKKKTRIILSYASGNYIAPDTVLEIDKYAFCNNQKILSFNLNNIEKIGNYAFLNCKKLTTILGGNRVNYVNKQAFTSTAWLNNNDLIILGSVLLKYNSQNNNSYNIPTNVSYIGEYAFGCDNLKEVIIPVNVETISNYAFVECQNLTKVYMLNTLPITIYRNSFLLNENLTIYVPGIYLNDYKNNFLYSNYVNNISPKWVSVTLLDGINLYKTISLKYYSIIENLNIPDKIGYDFLGWYCSDTNKTYNNGDIFDICKNNTSLIAIFEPSQYKLYLNHNSEDKIITSTTISYGEYFNFPIPSKNGYDFIGWFDGPNKSYKKYSDEEGTALLGWDKYDSSVLYAIFEKKQFSITYILNGGTNSINNPSVFYSDDVIVLEEPTKFGYGFNGWIINGCKGGIIEPGMYSDVTVTASWVCTQINPTGTEYQIRDKHIIINLDGMDEINDAYFYIENNVLQVTFICNNYKNFNACVIVEDRDLDLIINLKNVHFNAPESHHAIDAGSGVYTLYLNCQGSNSLKGADGVDKDNISSKDGYYGISAYKLILNGGNINISGGNGYSGSDGKNGANGVNSTDYPSGSFIKPIDGGNGEDGISGGNGAFAIYTISTFAYKNCHVTLTGGNGGNGGNAGVGSYAVNSDTSLGIKGADGIPGKGGEYGVGGSGGDAGDNGHDGENGENGVVGADAKLIITHFVKIDCETNNTHVPIKVNVEKQGSVFIEVTIQCAECYDFETLSAFGSTLKLYNKNKQEITTVRKIQANNGLDTVIKPYLGYGKYYLEVINSSNFDEEIEVFIKLEKVYYSNISIGSPKDVLSHMHRGVKTYNFSSSNSGLYYVKLNSTSQYGTIYLNGTIKVLYNGEIIEKFILNNYDNSASSIQNSDMIVFYAEKSKTYNIQITFDDYSVDTLNLSVNRFQPVSIENNDSYYSKESVIFGDNFKLWEVDNGGIYTFKLDYIGSCEQNIPFYVLREEDNSIAILESNFFSRYNSNREFNVSVKKGGKIYFGYLNGTSDGALITSFEKFISEEFSIVTDPNENVSVGTEVSINGGNYGGTVITVGLTRICYLGANAPDKTSRLKYEWNSSNEEIAIVSAYGTITAIRPGRVMITATYKNDDTIVGVIEIDVVPSTLSENVYLMYSMDCRVGGTPYGTEVSNGLGMAIAVSNNPKVTIHKSKTRLICLGEDSPSSSVQDFDWTTSDSSLASVSSYGTITAKSKSGTVTITGTYKYNTYYKVVIVIEVI